MTEHEWIHGPKTERQSETCPYCDYDEHVCGGCGEWLYHGTHVCGPCRLELVGEPRPESFEEEQA